MKGEWEWVREISAAQGSKAWAISNFLLHPPDVNKHFLLSALFFARFFRRSFHVRWLAVIISIFKGRFWVGWMRREMSSNSDDLLFWLALNMISRGLVTHDKANNINRSLLLTFPMNLSSCSCLVICSLTHSLTPTVLVCLFGLRWISVYWIRWSSGGSVEGVFWTPKEEQSQPKRAFFEGNWKWVGAWNNSLGLLNLIPKKTRNTKLNKTTKPKANRTVRSETSISSSDPKLGFQQQTATAAEKLKTMRNLIEWNNSLLNLFSLSLSHLPAFIIHC